ncbi:Syntaxin-73 [Morella rubra]|uniref:Syntaxin-73 n=1 Tax=Morella rubra TaxID=262757 RepID=A0A6A1W9J8_9ROSI|nr:Syntaxin-73 [Morella rubra]
MRRFEEPKERPKLQRLAFKKGRGFSKEELEARNDLVSALRERIEAIPDGDKQTGGWTASTSYSRIRIDSTSGGRFDSEYYQQTKESDHFRQAHEMRRTKQASMDKAVIVVDIHESSATWAQGLDTLKDMAHDMNEVVRANADLKNANVKTEGNCNPAEVQPQLLH